MMLRVGWGPMEGRLGRRAVGCLVGELVPSGVFVWGSFPLIPDKRR